MKTITFSKRDLLICLIVWFVSNIPAGASTTSEHNLQTVTLQLKWLHQFQFAGYYTALEKGYYQDVGLNVIIKEGKPGLVNADEVLSKNADYGIDMPVLLIDRNKGKPVVVLAAIFQHSPVALIARKDSGITSPHDMIGKRILLRPHGHAEITAMLRKEGISQNQLKIIAHSWDINDLIERRVDVSAAYITDFPFLMQERGIPYSLIRPITYGIDFYGDCLFTSEEKIKKQPDQVKAFLEASLKGWNYAMNHKEEIVDLILQKYSSRLSKDALLFEAKTMEELIFPNLIEMGHMNHGRWKHIGDTFVKLAMLDSDYSLQGFIYNPNPPTNYENVMKLKKILVGVLVIISISAILLLLYNRKLNIEVKKRTKYLSDEIEYRQKTEILLKETQSRLETILETLPVGVWYTNQKGKIIYGNHEGKNIWAGSRFVEPDKFHEYKAWWRKTGKLISPKEWAVSRAINKRESSVEEEIEIECFDGSHKIILNWATPFLDSDGNILGAVVVNQDITDRIQSDEQMKIQKLILDRSQKIAHLGSWHLDLEKNILTWSAEECRIFGRNHQDFIQTYESFLNAIHPDDRAMVDKTYTDAIKNKHPYECIHRVVHKNGEVRIVLEKSEDIIDEHGKTIHSFGFTQDITEQKMAEQEREELIKELQQSLNEIKILRDILPICSFCKNIRNDEGYYEQIESYFHKHSGVDFSHTICPKCMKVHYPKEYKNILLKKKN